MKDHPNQQQQTQQQQQQQTIRVSPIFNLLDYNIKINDVCWNQVKMTSSKWISCCHRIINQSRNNNQHQDSHSHHNNHHHHHHELSPSPFNTFSGRRNNHHHHHPHRWYSPSMQSENSFQSFIMNQSPTNSSSFCSSSSSTATTANTSDCDWTIDRLTQSSSSSSFSSIRSMPFPTTPIRPLPPHHQQHLTSSKFHRDLPPMARNHHYPYSNHFRSKDDSMMMMMMQNARSPAQSSNIQSVITLINPFEYLLINCETNLDTNCAQISPEQDIIAVSNEYWLAFYSIRDNDCFGMVQFPNKCLYWTWINSDSVAIITEDDVYHWSIMMDPSGQQLSLHDNSPKMIFSLNEDFKHYQIVNYSIDPLYGYWSALTALYLEDDEICGKIQIHSQSYGQSQCIDAHVATFVGYRFEGSANDSILLIACKRDTIHLWKLYIIELSTTANPANSYYKNRPMKSQHLMLHGFQRTTTNFTSLRNNNLHNNNHHDDHDEQMQCHKEDHNAQQQQQHPSSSSPSSSSSSCTTTAKNQFVQYDDIPTHIVCDNYIGLIFIISKYGSIYICDLETGIPLYYDILKQWTDNVAIFSISYDSKNSCLLALCRNGRVLVIKILLKKLLEHKKLQSNIRNRISQRIHCRKLSRMSSTPNNNNDNDDAVKNYRTVSISVNNNSSSSNNNNNNNNTRKKMNADDKHSNRSSSIIIIDDDDDDDDGRNNRSKKQTPSDNQQLPASFYIDQDDLVEEITRL
nr:uncharacterized protein LOC124498074 isoform X2 [Dermatophagoides farinae]XP_046917739.1 uncharacterized protein LOC124498074 isoform X2 [Dermatophagoides farinae]